MKNTIKHLFRLYANNAIASDTLCSILLAIEEDANATLMFKFGNSPILWTISEILETIWGYNKNNKKLLNENIEAFLKQEDELTILI